MASAKHWMAFLCRVGVLIAALIVTSCSLPNLESAQCAAARNTVKRFYSLHFANELTPAEEYLTEREKFLSDRLAEYLSSSEIAEDYFTQTEDFPKAFRVGGCVAESNDNATLQVVLLWRDDIRNDQTEVIVHTVRTDDRWLIDKVGN